MKKIDKKKQPGLAALKKKILAAKKKKMKIKTVKKDTPRTRAMGLA